MPDRKKFSEMLHELEANVYFQAPGTTSAKMQYPALVYERADIANQFANNKPYAQDVAYQVMVIAKDPDCELVMKVSQLPKARYDRHYTADGLHHDVFTIYE